MYSRPSTSYSRHPSPRLTKEGFPPTARNARTGEFTPPGMISQARENHSAEVVMGSMRRRGTERSRTEVAELQLQAEVLRLEVPDNRLELVDRGRLDAHLVLLDLRLHLLESPALDLLDDLLPLVGGDALLEVHALADLPTGGGLHRSVVQVADRHTSLDQLGLEYVDERLEAIIVVRDQRERANGFVEIDLRGRALEVVPLADLLARLVHCVVDLLEVDRGCNVEGGVLCHALALPVRLGGPIYPGKGVRQARAPAGSSDRGRPATPT